MTGLKDGGRGGRHLWKRVVLAAWLGVAGSARAYTWDGATWADNTAFMSPITQAVKDHCRSILLSTNGQTRTAGRLGQIGDSISYSSAYLVGAVCGGTTPNETGHDYLPIRQWLTGDAVPSYSSWYGVNNGGDRNGKGAEYGCLSGWKISDAVAAGHPAAGVNIGRNGVPGNYALALIMFGTNDIDDPAWTAAAWRTAYSNVVQGFIAQGVIPVLSTIPPERAHVGDGRVEAANEVIRGLAAAMAIPCVDYYGLIVHHQPTTWDGTLISATDGTHPSNGGAGSTDFSRMALTTNNGYTARTKLTLDMAEKLKAIVFENGAAEVDAASGSWIGYEGKLHQSSSPEDVAGPLSRLWERRFTEKVSIPSAEGWSLEIGNHCARNLTYSQGCLGLVASVTNQEKRTANVTILDATNGAVVNCVAVENSRHGAYKSMLDATETAWGEHVAAWDPDTGILFMAIGGDMPEHTAILPLANRTSYTGTLQPAVGAYGVLATNFPNLRGSNDRRRDADDAWTGAGSARDGGALGDDEWGDCQNRTPNRTAMFDVQAGSPYLAISRAIGHESANGSSLTTKYTGLYAKKPHGDMSNPTDFDQAHGEAGFPCFHYWGGMLVDSNCVYFLGPYESGVNPDDLQQGSRGLRVASMVMSNADLRVNGSYTGPGTDETAMPLVKRFDVAFDSTTTNINESWHQSGAFNEGLQRNKAWMVQGDGVWVAWKPSRTSAVELVRASATESNRYSLGIGQNMRYQDIWPNIAYTDCGANGRYVVYYAANAYTGMLYTQELTPPGPATLTVFDADSRTVRWTFELNNASRTGAYPDLPPNAAELWYEASRLVVAGRYAHIAWVDTVGAGNARLQVATFDVTGAAPVRAPTASSFDLGIPKEGNRKSRVTDLIAVSDMLYALVTEDDTYDRSGKMNAQRVVALRGGVTPLTATIEVTPATGTAPLSVTCSGSRSIDPEGTITNYAWTFGDGSTPTNGVTVQHVYANAGSYAIRLTVTSSLGNSNTAQRVLSVTAAPQYVTNTYVVTCTNAITPAESPVQDTFLRATDAANDGFRNLDNFMASSFTNDIRIPLLRFDLSSIPGNAEVINAVMKLYCYNIAGFGEVVVYPMTKPWVWNYACYNYRDNAPDRSAGVWWNVGNQPFDYTPPTADYDAASGVTNRAFTFQYVNWDVTAMASNWVANPSGNRGVVLVPVAADNEIKFRSTNYTNEPGVQPTLVVTVRSVAVEPKPTAMLMIVR